MHFSTVHFSSYTNYVSNSCCFDNKSIITLFPMELQNYEKEIVWHRSNECSYVVVEHLELVERTNTYLIQIDFLLYITLSVSKVWHLDCPEYPIIVLYTILHNHTTLCTTLIPYFSNRKSSMIGNYSSVQVSSGLLQGSILGPIQFIGIYVSLGSHHHPGQYFLPFVCRQYLVVPFF